MRSKLFVPGSRTELFTKALNSNADAISLDLEDSVVEDRKAEARKNIAEFLRSPDVDASDKIIIVRVNELGSAHFEADILAIMQSTLDMVNLPKVESADDICAAVDVIEQAEKANGISKEVSILANIESPKGVIAAAEIAGAHPRVTGLQLGLNDLVESLSMDRNDIKNVHAVMFAMRMAAGSAGIFAYDGAFADIKDKDGFRAEAEMAYGLGFLGKSCIHPSQIAPVHEIFAYSEAEITFSLRVIEEAKGAAAKGVGVFTVDGKMIDLPMIRRAEAIVSATRGQKI